MWLVDTYKRQSLVFEKLQRGLSLFTFQPSTIAKLDKAWVRMKHLDGLLNSSPAGFLGPHPFGILQQDATQSTSQIQRLDCMAKAFPALVSGFGSQVLVVQVALVSELGLDGVGQVGKQAVREGGMTGEQAPCFDVEHEPLRRSVDPTLAEFWRWRKVVRRVDFNDAETRRVVGQPLGGFHRTSWVPIGFFGQGRIGPRTGADS